MMRRAVPSLYVGLGFDKHTLPLGRVYRLNQVGRKPGILFDLWVRHRDIILQ